MHPFRSRVVCFAAVVALGTSMTSACKSDTANAPLENLSEVLARVAPARPFRALPDVDEPSSYRMTLDRYVTGRSDNTIVRDGKVKRKRLRPATETRSVVRPLNETGSQIRRLGFVREAGAGESRVTLMRPLPDDPRPRLYLGDAPTPRQERTVAGRRCAVHVVGATEYCVDAAGLVLVARDRDTLEIATKVTRGNETRSVAQLRAPLAKGFLDTTRGSIRPVDPDTAPGGVTDYSLDAPPDGFTLVGRYAVVPVSKELLARSSRRVIAGIVDVYVRGADAVMIERGGKLDTTTVDESDLGSLVDVRDVDLGALGIGKVGIAGIGPWGYREVRATPSQGRYVVVAGTLAEDQLIALARALQPWPGTELRYLDKAEEGPTGPTTTALPAPRPGP
jgi:hypothetical protein